MFFWAVGNPTHKKMDVQLLLVVGTAGVNEVSHGVGLGKAFFHAT